MRKGKKIKKTNITDSNAILGLISAISSGTNQYI